MLSKILAVTLVLLGTLNANAEIQTSDYECLKHFPDAVHNEDCKVDYKVSGSRFKFTFACEFFLTGIKKGTGEAVLVHDGGYEATPWSEHINEDQAKRLKVRAYRTAQRKLEFLRDNYSCY